VAVACAERFQRLKIDIVTDVIKPDHRHIIDNALQTCENARLVLDGCNDDVQQ